MEKETNKIEEMFRKDPAELALEPSGAEEKKGENEPENENDAPETGDKPQPKKNHQDRRWDKLFGKLEETQSELSELRNFRQDVESGKFSTNKDEVPEHFKKMYADGLTVEERWKANQEYETRREQEIEQRVLGKLRQEDAEKKKWDDFIDTKLEDLEEEYKVDFTSGSAKAERLKREFLEEVIEFSPKDEHGNITAYAPFDKVYERFAESRKKPDTITERKKDIASLSGQRSSSTPPPQNEVGDGGWFGWKNHMK